MNLRLLRLLPFALLMLIITACSSNEAKIENDATSVRPVSGGIGSPLFTAMAWPKLADDAASLADPIRVPNCHLTALDRVEVPTREDGTIDWHGTERAPGQQVDPKDLYIHPRTKKEYVRLRPGDQVKKNQIIAMLVDDLASLECDIAVSNIEGAKEEHKAATEAITHYEANLDIEIKANSSTSAIVAAKANLAKAKSEQASKAWTVKRTEGESKKAQEKLKHHYIRAPFDGEIVQFIKRVGEGAKGTEAVLQMQNTARLGVEGNLEVQFASKVAVGNEVFLEPSLMEPPLPWRSPHPSSKPITAVAVGMRDKRSVAISASEDGSVYVWDPKGIDIFWRHPGPVRALAVTRPGVERPLILTGCDDGKARLYALDVPEREPVLTLDGHHEGGVSAAAFSPDGAFCVTADDRGGIYLFDTQSGKRRYAFPPEHTAPVTSLQFTPQCRVVSAGRDNRAIIWKVGDESAEVDMSFDHRAGELTNLGVSDDGGQMLLDRDKYQLAVIDLAGHRNLGKLQLASDSKFTSFALLSPTIGAGADRVILTTGGADGVLQVWRWTAGAGRGSELKKLVCTGYPAVTCAAFSPIAQDGYIIAGTRKGDVRVWHMPTADELTNRFKARITNISPNLESSGKTVRIIAEYDNTDPRLHLRPGSTATMVIPQK